MSFNEEQFEAGQIEINKTRQKYIKSLPEEDQKKFKAVEKAVKLLVDNKVKFYLFPYLPNDNFTENIMWQWNSVYELIEKNEMGFPTEESKILTNKIFERLLYSIFGATLELYPNCDKLLGQEKFNLFLHEVSKSVIETLKTSKIYGHLYQDKEKENDEPEFD